MKLCEALAKMANLRVFGEKKTIEIFKEPLTSEEWTDIRPYFRGVLLINGILYLASGFEVLHQNIIKVMSLYGPDWVDDPESFDEFVCIEGSGTKQLKLSTSYYGFMDKLFKEKYLEKYQKALKEKNSRFELKLL